MHNLLSMGDTTVVSNKLKTIMLSIQIGEKNKYFKIRGRENLTNL